jgi:hypothetical protein
VRIEPSAGYEDGNLAFVVRLVGNSMRNGHSTFTQCAEAFDSLAAEREAATASRLARA